MCVTLVLNNLWREILRRPTHGPCAVIHALRKTEVCNANVTTVVNQHVFRLQIAEDDVEIVQEIERQNRLS